MSQHDQRMSNTEALMWKLEKDPYLASSFANIAILDRSPNMDVLYTRMERTAILFPRLRRKVQQAPGNFGNPTWVDDQSFDIRYHVRHMSLAAPGNMRQLLDLGTLLVADPFDLNRPLWQFFVVDGLPGGRSALIQKLHHTVSDGQGAVELAMHYLDAVRNPGPLEPLEPEIANATYFTTESNVADEFRGAMDDALRVPMSVLRQVRDVLSDTSLLSSITATSSATIKDLVSQLNDNDASRSPLWTKRSTRRRMETARVPYESLRSAAKSMGGTLNTAFITAAAHASGLYHRELGAPVDSLRASMAISTRTAESGGNAFTLARMLVPTNDMPISERFTAVNEILTSVREKNAVSSIETIATFATFLPAAFVTRLARTQAETVDFATSNIPGASFELFFGGAKLLENYPIGPLGGVAFNLTLMSYLGSLDVGINIDTQAIESPELLRDLLHQSFTELTDLAPLKSSKPESASKRRWWQRLR